MRRLLLRAAVLTGGCAAGLVIGLSLSSAAHADDRPQPIRDLITDVTNAVDSVLPDPEPPDKAPKADAPTQPPARPVKNIVDEVVDEVEDVVEDIADIPPATPVDNPVPDDTPVDADEPAVPTTPITSEPASIAKLAEPSTPTTAPPGTLTTGHTRTRHETPQAVDYDGDPSHDTPWETLIRTLTDRPSTPPAPDYRSPTRPLPTPTPGHDATPSVSVPHAPTIGIDQPATLAARTPAPDTTPVRIPGRDLAADGMTHSPDAPSG